ncbi:hypothetical protein GCM10025859_01000 [Alicyclobacillus fastidiosus]|nr:hypothetical protein GCM10025859_01000 [Alicyclobacillus fastidiosus]
MIYYTFEACVFLGTAIVLFVIWASKKIAAKRQAKQMTNSNLIEIDTYSILLGVLFCLKPEVKR